MEHPVRNLLIGVAMVGISLFVVGGLIAGFQARDRQTQIAQYARNHPM